MAMDAHDALYRGKIRTCTVLRNESFRLCTGRVCFAEYDNTRPQPDTCSNPRCHHARLPCCQAGARAAFPRGCSHAPADGAARCEPNMLDSRGLRRILDVADGRARPRLLEAGVSKMTVWQFLLLRSPRSHYQTPHLAGALAVHPYRWFGTRGPARVLLLHDSTTRAEGREDTAPQGQSV